MTTCLVSRPSTFVQFLIATNTTGDPDDGMSTFVDERERDP